MTMIGFPVDDGAAEEESPLALVADWGPADDWADWAAAYTSPGVRSQPTM